MSVTYTPARPPASGLLSLRLSSALLPTYDILSTAPLEDLYICLRGRSCNPLKQWIQALPNLTNLTVLTIFRIALRVCPQCCLVPFHQDCPAPFVWLWSVSFEFTVVFALQRVYALARFGSATCLTKLRKLPSLRELQLLMFATASTNLAHIYMFLRTCRCPQLERLFVQVSGEFFAFNAL